MVHDETRGVIQESYQVHDASASRRVIVNLYFMQIRGPQIIEAVGDESVIVNTDRPIHGCCQGAQYLVDGVIRWRLARQRDQLGGELIATLNTAYLVKFPDRSCDESRHPESATYLARS
jgi:hypothetical protein